MTSNLATRILALPLEIRNMVWRFYFDHEPFKVIRPILNIYDGRDSIKYSYCGLCRQPHFHFLRVANRPPLINKSLYLEASRWAFASVEKAVFCDINCFLLLIKNPKQMDFLSFTPRIEFMAPWKGLRGIRLYCLTASGVIKESAKVFAVYTEVEELQWKFKIEDVPVQRRYRRSNNAENWTVTFFKRSDASEYVDSRVHR
jgi:hypothetical protein